ncbi:MAG: type II secretion system protein [Cyanobium sp.]
MRRLPASFPRAPAYTLLELLMVVSVLSVLATASWRVITNDLHRSRLNAVGFAPD